MLDGKLESGMVATKYEANPWMNFDLGRKRIWVDRIVLVNRSDRFSNQLNGAIVAVSEKYSGMDLMTKKDPEIYRIRLSNVAAAVTIRPGKFGEGKWAKNVMVYHLPTSDNSGAVIAMKQVMVFSNQCNCANYWRHLPGGALDIAVGGGKTWLIGTDHTIWSSTLHPTRLFKMKAPWKKLTHGPKGRRIAVGPMGNPWIVGTNYRIYRYQIFRNMWRDMGMSGKDITSGGGRVWVIGAENQIHSAYMANMNVRPWEKMPWDIQARHISADLLGNLWVVGMDHFVRGYKNNTKKWKQYPIQAKDIGVSPGDRSGGKAFIIEWSNVPYSFEKKKNKFVRMPGQGRRISVGTWGRPWLIGMGTDIWAWYDYKN